MKKILFLFLLICSLNIFADNIYVGENESIQTAINGANPGDVIILLGSHYNLSNSLNVTTNNLTIKGNVENPLNCIVDGNNSVNLISISGSYVTLKNICFQNGAFLDGEHACGITFVGSEDSCVENCIIRNCFCTEGWGVAGILCRYSNLNISNVEAYGNTGGSWGFMRVLDSGDTLFINNCIIHDNQGGYTGGLVGNGCEGSQILKMSSCLFYNNVGGNYGGIEAVIEWFNNAAYIENSTFTKNITEEFVLEGITKITNCIVWDNIVDNNEIGEVTYSDVEGGYSGVGNINEDPLFVNPEQTDFHLTQLSPCVDAGDPTFPLDPDETIADMGCYYFHHEYDIRHFHSGWQWISFPYLTEQGISDGEIYEQAYYQNNLPGLLQNTAFASPTITGFERIDGFRGYQIFIEYNPPAFGDYFFNNRLFRYEGYKLKVADNAEPSILIVDGERLESYTIEEMPALENFWLGYYIPYPQNIKDAFGYGTDNDFWGDVNKVWAEDWYYDAQNNQRGDISSLPSNSTKGKTLEYGKMYIVQMYRDVTNFSWNGSNIIEQPIKKEKPQNFTYEEKADYEVIDVVDIPSDVNEIGVFEDDKCVGAVAVKDSSAQILVYSDEANRNSTPFTFEIITGRGCKTEVTDYLVLNMKTGKFEPSVVISGKQGYSAIKFGKIDDDNSNVVNTHISLYNNYPNPFNPTTTIRYSVAKDCKVKINIYNLKGQLVKKLFEGNVKQGSYSLNWSGTNDKGKKVASGLYLYRLITKEKIISKKMLLLK